MNVGSDMPQYMAHWFTEPVIRPGHTGGFATIKPEYMEQFQQVYKERCAIAKAEEASLPPRPMQVKLTDEQKSYLSRTYNRSNMSAEEYEAFAEDLHTFGILNGKDLEDLRLRGGGFVLLEDAPCGTWSSPLLPAENDCLFGSYGGGNVFDWVRYRASLQLYDEETGTYSYDRVGRLFNRLYSVLEQIDSSLELSD